MEKGKPPERVQRFWLPLVMMSIVAVSAAGYLYYRHEADRIRQQKYDELAAIANLKIGQITQWRQERLNDVSRSSRAPFFRQGLQEWLKERENAELRARLHHRLALEQKEKRYADVLLFDTAGCSVLLSAEPHPHPLSPGAKIAIEQALASRAPVLSDLYLCPKGMVHLDAVGPIMGGDGQPVAVLVLRSNAETVLYPVIQMWPTPSKTAETLLVRRDGDDILFLNDIRHRPNTALSLREPLTLIDLAAVQAVLGREGMFQGRDYRGVEVLADLRPVPESPWFMVAKVDASEILAEASYRGGVVLLFAVLFILLFVSIVGYGYRYRQVRVYRDLYRSERERRGAQEEFRTTLYSIGDAVIITDKSGVVKHMNPTAERLTGWTETEARGRSVEEVFHIINEKTRQPCENPVQRVLQEGQIVGLANHTLLISREGIERVIADSGSPIRDGDGTMLGVVLVFRDMTDQARAEKALEESEQRYRALFETAGDAIYIFRAEGDEAGQIVDANETAAQMHGYARDEFVSLKISDLDTPESAKKIPERMERLLADGRVRDEVTHRRKDGTIFPMEINARLVRLGEQELVLAIDRDITDRKRAEEDLRVSEDRFRRLFEQAPLIYVITRNEQGVPFIIDCNELFARTVGYTREEVVGQPLSAFYSAESRIALLDGGGYARALAGAFFIGERQLATRDGTHVPTLLYTARELDGSGNVVGTRAMFVDITEQKNAQQALQASETFLNSVIDQSPYPTWISDQHGTLIRMNKALGDLLRISDEEVVGKYNVLMDNIVEAQGLLPLVKSVFEEDAVVRFELNYDSSLLRNVKLGRSTSVILDVTIFPIKDSDGNITNAVIQHMDITERRRAEEALRTSEERLRLAQRSANVGIWEWNTDDQTLSWTPETESLYGLDSGTVHSYADWAKMVHPEDLSRIESERDEAIAQHSLFEFEFRVLHPTGETRWLQARGGAIYDEAGNNPLRVLGVNIDITQRKEMECALAESEERYRTVADFNHDWEYWVSTEDKLLYVSPSCERITGYTAQEFLDDPGLMERIVHPDDLAGVCNHFHVARKMDYDRSYDVDFRIIHRGGSVRWIGHACRPVHGQGGQPLGRRASNRDITDRKKTEEALIESESRVRRKLLSILLPEGDLGTLELADVMDVEQTQILMDNFFSLTNIGVGIIDLQGKLLVGTGWQDICLKFHRVHPESQQNCIKSDRELSTGIQEGDFRLYRCPNNMWDMATPIIVAGNHLGNLFLGQFLFEDERPDYEIFREQARKYGFDEAEYIAALERVPRWSRETVDRVMRFYASIMNMISTLGYSNVRLARSQAEQEHLINSLRESEERYRAVVDNLQVGISVINPNMEVVAINKFFGAYYPSVCPGAGQVCYSVYNDPPRSAPCSYCPCVLTFQDGEVHECETETPAGGKIRNYRIVSCPVKDVGGEVQLVIELVEDVTERRSLFAQLAQAQKMEAIGTLAGGVAHDFNNILQVASGYSELLLTGKTAKDPDYDDLQKIYQVARSGSELVKNLLAFSRKSEPKPVPMDLNHQVTHVEKLLQRTIPKMIQIRLDLAGGIARINADPTQVEQVLMNLAVNARDAMGESGTLIIRTEDVALDEEYCKLNLEAIPGDYVLLSVSDTGHGMGKETLMRIFEPFYTTKELGRGTGLGLAMVYGIVKQHGGHIDCYSEVGKGTTFKLYFPAIDSVEEPEVEETGVMPAFGTETVLLVDDEDSVRDLGERILKRNGYTVLTAVNGEEALDIYKRYKDRIALIILDLIMPTMGGKDCLQELLKIDAAAKALIASGYAADDTTKECVKLGAKGFVAKPYRFKDLLQQVRKALDER